MNINRLAQVLIRHEGLRLKPYCDKTGKTFIPPEDCGHLTIGVGKNLDAFTKEDALLLLYNDIYRINKQLEEKLPFFKELDNIRQEVLINMAFNLGVEGLLKFKKTLKLIEEGKYKEAAKEMLNSKWDKQVGRRAEELSYTMEHGEYPFDIDYKEDKLLKYINNLIKDGKINWESF